MMLVEQRPLDGAGHLKLLGTEFVSFPQPASDRAVCAKNLLQRRGHCDILAAFVSQGAALWRIEDQLGIGRGVRDDASDDANRPAIGGVSGSFETQYI
jgi:hypothetical protein